ncbi:MAG: Xaa-Pro peptidase family protein [Clostridiales bacterium]|nr:Xaa-Pro peptidase family protein [Clostridiales bacterium]
MKRYKELFGNCNYPVLLTSPQNIFYVTDFYTTARRPGQIGYNCVLMMPDKNYFFIPAAWKDLVAETIPLYSTDSCTPVDASFRTELVPYRGDLQHLASVILDVLNDFQNTMCIGYEEEDLSLELYRAMQELAAQTQQKKLIWANVSGLLKSARCIKSASEIKHLRTSACVASDAMEYAKELLLPGRQELDVVAELEHFMRKNGSEGVPFTMKVLSGENALRTINLPGERKIREGEIVLLDFGATVKNYASDWTRSFCIGKASPMQKELYQLVWKIERNCIALIRPGVTYAELMQQAFRLLEGHPWKPYFNPFLGHSIGISSQEWPTITPGSDQILKENMIITIEPGIYVPGIGGVRIEDEVLVTADGYEVLTGLDQEIFELR